MTRSSVRRYRSLLYVPGHKLDWALKAPSYGSDGLILDLEDSVPEGSKDAARTTSAEALRSLSDSNVDVFVRVNPWRTGRLIGDVSELVPASPAGFLLPKVSAPGDIAALDAVLTELEIRSNLPVGEIEIIPGCESANAMKQFYEICDASPRVRRCPGGPRLSPNGDTSRALGLVWTEQGREELYITERSVFSAKAAGVDQVLARLTGDIHDKERLQRTALFARSLGCYGSLVVHPNQVTVANAVFAIHPELVDSAVETLDALVSATCRGDGVAVVDGWVVDLGHGVDALQLLDEANDAGWAIEVKEEWRQLAESR
jgi:citrate lyase subunit beta/citryl-CoA lyase